MLNNDPSSYGRSYGYQTTSAIIDGLLRFLIFGGILGTAAVAPNAIKLWDKPTQILFRKLDKRAREREYARVLRYMRQQGLVKISSDNYEHGLLLTNKGRARALKANIDNLHIPSPKKWDRNWRIVFFDIPEHHKTRRDAFSHKLRSIGFVPLQRSVWIHPFPCRREIEAIATACRVESYITYIETGYIDSEEKLEERFGRILSTTTR